MSREEKICGRCIWFKSYAEICYDDFEPWDFGVCGDGGLKAETVNYDDYCPNFFNADMLIETSEEQIEQMGSVKQIRSKGDYVRRSVGISA